MAKKKNVEEVVISRKELTPTTIGTIETKESGPIVAIIWVLIFVGGIFILPRVSTWVNDNFIEKKPTPTVKPTTPSTPVPTDPSLEEPEDEIKYYDLEDGLMIDFEGFQFTNISADNTTKLFTARLINISGKQRMFQDKSYYIELYSEDNTLLQRFLIPKEEITSFKNLSYSMVSNYQIVKKMAIVLKEEKDYPQVSLQKNQNNEGVLECEKGNEIFTYIFKENSNQLVRIQESFTAYSSSSDYNQVLNQYTTLASTLKNMNGVEAELTPLRNGFYYEALYSLEEMNSSDISRYLTKFAHYKKDTEAKVVAFELNSSGYTCR